MAIITTIITKKYEFCDDIKSHILSFLGAKPMRLTDLSLVQEIIVKYQQRDSLYYKNFPIYSYRLRMIISKEQFQYEASVQAAYHRTKYFHRQKVLDNRRKLLISLEDYWLDALNSPRINNPHTYINYVKDCHSLISLVGGIHYPTNIYIRHINLKRYLDSIREAGEENTKRLAVKRREDEYTEQMKRLLFSQDIKRMAYRFAMTRQKINVIKTKQALSKSKKETREKILKEKIVCPSCSKSLTRGSYPRHQKKCKGTL